MKKQYLTPVVRPHLLGPTKILCNSGSTKSSNVGSTNVYGDDNPVNGSNAW